MNWFIVTELMFMTFRSGKIYVAATGEDRLNAKPAEYKVVLCLTATWMVALCEAFTTYPCVAYYYH